MGLIAHLASSTPGLLSQFLSLFVSTLKMVATLFQKIEICV
jgi:hypothetical protein